MNDGSLVPLDAAYFPGFVEVPQANRFVRAGREELPAGWPEGDRVDIGIVSEERAHALSGVQLPQTDGVIAVGPAGGRQNKLAVLADVQAMDRSLMTHQQS